MGNEKSKPKATTPFKVQLDDSKTNKQKHRSVPERAYMHRMKPKLPRDETSLAAKQRFVGNTSMRTHCNSTKNLDIADQQNMRDVTKVLNAIKPFNYQQFCSLLQTHPFIQHWKIFEEAVHLDLTFCLPNDNGEITPAHHSFTLRLMDNGYQITEKELDRMEMRLFLKWRFSVLKTCIVDHYLSGVKSLQELCRLSLKKSHQHHEGNYRNFVMNLNYPEKLKKFLLQ